MWRAALLFRLEAVLVVIRCGLGLADKPSLPQAKKLLRDRDGKALASRLGRISKLRNSAAHLDVGLPGDVDQFLSDVSGAEGGKDVVEEEVQAEQYQLQRDAGVKPLELEVAALTGQLQESARQLEERCAECATLQHDMADLVENEVEHLRVLTERGDQLAVLRKLFEEGADVEGDTAPLEDADGTAVKAKIKTPTECKKSKEPHFEDGDKQNIENLYESHEFDGQQRELGGIVAMAEGVVRRRRPGQDHDEEGRQRAHRGGPAAIVRVRLDGAGAGPRRVPEELRQLRR